MLNKEGDGIIPHPEGLSQFQEWFLERFFDAGGLEFGKFKLKLHEKMPDAPRSNNRINLINAAAYENLRFAVARFYIDLIRHYGLACDLFAAVPTSSVPFVEALSEISDTKMIVPQIKEERVGGKVVVAGIGREDRGRTALVVDDVITGADSKLEAIEALSDAGIRVKDVMVAIDREQGGKEELHARGYNLYSVMTLSQILSFYRRIGKINEETYESSCENTRMLSGFIKSH